MMDMKYRSAVALNNMGTALLQRYAFHDALDTFRDALQIMQVVCSRSPQRSNETSSLPESVIDSMLRNAAERLCKKSTRLALACPPFIDVVVHDSGEHDAIRSTLDAADSTIFVAQAVRIEYSDSEGQMRIMEYDEKSSLIMYNMGMAHLCMAKVSKKARDIRKLLNSSSNIFRLNQGVLYNLSQVVNAKDYGIVKFMEVVLFSAINLKGIIHTVTEMKNEQLEALARDNLYSYQTLLMDLGEFWQAVASARFVNAAAAAA